MDALKRAELAKQQGQSEADSGLSLEPTATPESGAAPTTLPELPKLEDLDAEFMAGAGNPAVQRQAPATGGAQPAGPSSRRGAQRAWTGDSTADAGTSREAVRNAFAVKGGAGNDRKAVLIVAALGLLAVGGVGAWFWLQFKPVQSLAAARPAAGQDLAVRQGVVAPPPAAVDTRPAAPAMSAAIPPAPPASARHESDEDEQLAAPRSVAPARATTRRTPHSPVLPQADAAIRVTTATQGIDPGVADGYRLLQAGNLNAAKAAYAGALRADPRNADALHGIAAISLREGRLDVAAAIYQQILEANPVDAAAQAGLMGLNGHGDPVAGESRMKSLLAAQGDLPAVNFALGNLYARQQRWNEAQQAYFKAVTADAGNPDYLFNLAVSLDQIQQPRLAAQYYGQALTAADNRPAAFDRAQASRRLRELQP